MHISHQTKMCNHPAGCANPTSWCSLIKVREEQRRGCVALGITSLHVVILTVRERPEPLPLLDTDDLSMFVAIFV